MSRIQYLAVEAFRGATRKVELTFQKDRPVIVIYGENGSGKSTLVDALDAVCNAQPGSIRDRSIANRLEYLPSIGSPASALAVELKWGNKTWKVGLKKTKLVVEGDADRPEARILRRSQILGLLEAVPSDRYKEFAKFISFPNVEKAEATLRAARDEIRDSYNAATIALEDAKRSLADLWEREGRPSESALSWGRSLERSTADELKAVATATTNLIKLIDAAVAARETHREAATARETADAAAAATRALADEAASAVHAVDRDLLPLLEAARAYLQAHGDAPACPVCASDVDMASIRASIEARIDSNDRGAKASGLAREAERDARAAMVAAATEREKLTAFKAAADALLVAVSASDMDFVSEHVAEPVAAIEATKAGSALPGGRSWGLGAFVGHVETLVPRLREAGERAREDVGRLHSVSMQVATIREKTRESEELDALVARASRALAIVEARRKRQVEGMLAGAAARANELYAHLHPDEAIGGVRFALDAKARASLNMEARFHGHADVPPQAVYSESHLDTLGICIFLALAERYGKGRVIVVLDDVLTSTDEAHIGRFLELLHDHYCGRGRPQVILTSHYRAIKERYTSGLARAGHSEIIELRPWTFGDGIRHGRAQLRTEDLEAKLASHPLDCQGAAAHAGVMLESVLKTLARVYRSRVEYKPDDRYEIQELLDAITKKIPSMKVSQNGPTGSVAAAPLAPIFDRLRPVLWVRNRVGAHHNEDGLGVAPADVVDYAGAVLALAQALTCSGCLKMMTKASESAIYCDCEKPASASGTGAGID